MHGTTRIIIYFERGPLRAFFSTSYIQLLKIRKDNFIIQKSIRLL